MAKTRTAVSAPHKKIDNRTSNKVLHCSVIKCEEDFYVGNVGVMRKRYCLAHFHKAPQESGQVSLNDLRKLGLIK